MRENVSSQIAKNNFLFVCVYEPDKGYLYLSETSLTICEAITKLALTVDPHPPYRLYLAPSDIFGTLKVAVYRNSFEFEDEGVSQV